MIRRLLILALSLSSVSLAAVQSVEIPARQDVLHGKTFGSAGAYEALAGRVHFAVDPSLAANQNIADINLAPRNDRGQVAFSSDFYILRPKDPKLGNGTALVEISNRGGKGLLSTFDFGTGPLHLDSPESFGDGFLLNRGYTLVWVGWEFDLPPVEGLLHLSAPVATDHGRTITGMVRAEWTGDAAVDSISVGDRTQAGYPAADPASAKNRLFVRDHAIDAPTLVPRSQWKFIDSTHVALSGSFTPGRIYEFDYEAKDPAVAGLGLAAIRDFVSFLKNGGSETGLADEHRFIKRSIGFGISQSGRFLREFLYDGFNVDEQGREVFDGVWAHVAGAGRGSFNQRFAQPSRDGHPFLNVFYPVDVPFFDEEHLLEKEHRAHAVPKLFLTNGAYEYWGRAASLIHTTADGKADAPPSPGTRIYFFAGSQHTPGSIPPRAVPAQNAANLNDYRYAMRALVLAMQSWLTGPSEPPPSVFPRLKQQQLTALSGLHFPTIPDVHVPQHKREAFRIDFAAEPIKAGPPFPTLVPQVDADGNDLGGIRMPEIETPLATYTGWNLRSQSIGAPDEMYTFTGSTIPFALTKNARLEKRDPRPSIEERYANENQYLDRIDHAAKALVKQGFLLDSDCELIHARAIREWNYVHGL